MEDWLKWKTGFQAARMKVIKTIPTVTHLLQQGHIHPNKGHTHPNKATPSNSATPWVELEHLKLQNPTFTVHFL